MTRKEFVVLYFDLCNAHFQVAFIKYPSREDVRAALRNIWENFDKATQDLSFDFLTFPDFFPEIQLPHKAEHHTMAGCVRVSRLPMWDNG